MVLPVAHITTVVTTVSAVTIPAHHYPMVQTSD